MSERWGAGQVQAGKLGLPKGAGVPVEEEGRALRGVERGRGKERGVKRGRKGVGSSRRGKWGKFVSTQTSIESQQLKQ